MPQLLTCGGANLGAENPAQMAGFISESRPASNSERWAGLNRNSQAPIVAHDRAGNRTKFNSTADIYRAVIDRRLVGVGEDVGAPWQIQ